MLVCYHNRRHLRPWNAQSGQIVHDASSRNAGLDDQCSGRRLDQIGIPRAAAGESDDPEKGLVVSPRVAGDTIGRLANTSPRSRCRLRCHADL